MKFYYEISLLDTFAINYIKYVSTQTIEEIKWEISIKLLKRVSYQNIT